MDCINNVHVVKTSQDLREYCDNKTIDRNHILILDTDKIDKKIIYMHNSFCLSNISAQNKNNSSIIREICLGILRRSYSKRQLEILLNIFNNCEIIVIDLTYYFSSLKNMDRINQDYHMEEPKVNKAYNSEQNGKFIYDVFKNFLINNRIKDYQSFKNLSQLAKYKQSFPEHLLSSKVIEFFNHANIFVCSILNYGADTSNELGFVHSFMRNSISLQSPNLITDFTILFPISSTLLVYEYLRHYAKTDSMEFADLKASKILLLSGTSDVLTFVQNHFPISYHNVFDNIKPVQNVRLAFLKDLASHNTPFEEYDFGCQQESFKKSDIFL
jgi:hypothetical protein